jgi:mRNA interferase MazF
MEKDFKKWNTKKIEINSITGHPFFHEREIWFSCVGLNIGFEQDGRGDDFLRPVVVLRKFGNGTFLAVPITKTDHDRWYYFQFSFVKNLKSAAIVTQIRVMNGRRLGYKIGEISPMDFETLKTKIRTLLS